MKQITMCKNTRWSVFWWDGTRVSKDISIRIWEVLQFCPIKFLSHEIGMSYRKMRKKTAKWMAVKQKFS